MVSLLLTLFTWSLNSGFGVCFLLFPEWVRNVIEDNCLIRRTASLSKLLFILTHETIINICEVFPVLLLNSLKRLAQRKGGVTWSLLQRLNLNVTIWVTIETDSQFYLLCLKSWNHPSVRGLIYNSVRNVKPSVSNKLLTVVTLWCKFMVLIIRILGLGRN